MKISGVNKTKKAVPDSSGTALLVRKVLGKKRPKYLILLAEGVGFEPTVPCGTTDFESVTFDHSDTPPRGR